MSYGDGDGDGDGDKASTPVTIVEPFFVHLICGLPSGLLVISTLPIASPILLALSLD